ncbi:MAG: ATP-dependent protease ATPase subunit HslU [Candidatus Hinthialibacteria bacterium OLB16]|nr:MAG: ATP-dependent protease ATPase subunit HslU [Candidatus Hinthialibacteria bacterium OLB16]
MALNPLENEKTPREIVEELNKYIVGQYDAKKAVALALRTRWRRLRLPEDKRTEIYPKNILMIGPTGVGKTEIARRLARMTDAPFLKVEASKFTEVGYVGRDVESMIRDLVEVSVNQMRVRRQEECDEEAHRAVEERLLNLLLPPAPMTYSTLQEVSPSPHQQTTREKLRTMLREGKLEDREVEVELPERSVMVQGFIPGAGMEEMQSNLQEMLRQDDAFAQEKQAMKISEARPHLFQSELEHLVDEEALVGQAISRVEQAGIVFLDEMDKIIGNGQGSGPDVSREGVQRDILPLVEGSTVKTKHGFVNTDHILFIGAGAFYGTSPSDLIPELQGRFPIRVELDSLGKTEFVQILKEPENSLTKQYKSLLETEGVLVEFEDSAIDEMAEMAAEINDKTDNIGARRLHTIIEKVIEEISFIAPETPGKKFVLDAKLVRERLSEIVKDQDLSRYIL